MIAQIWALQCPLTLIEFTLINSSRVCRVAFLLLAEINVRSQEEKKTTELVLEMFVWRVNAGGLWLVATCYTFFWKFLHLMKSKQGFFTRGT